MWLVAVASVEGTWPGLGTMVGAALLAGGGLGVLTLAGRWWRYRRLRRRYRAVLRAEGWR